MEVNSTAQITPASIMSRVSGQNKSVQPAQAETLNYAGLDNKKPDEIGAVDDPVLDIGAIRHHPIVAEVKSAWERNKYAKIVTDGRLLNCLRMARGEYSAADITLFAQSGSSSAIYMKLAAVKCAALASWLEEILMAPGDRPCGLEPRHLPKLPDPVTKMIQDQAGQTARQMMVQSAQQGNGIMDQQSFMVLWANLQDELESQVKHEYRVKAKAAANKMEDAVFQEMDNGGFDNAFRAFLEHFSRYPTAFLKGPFQRRKKSLTWGPAWEPIVESKARLTWKAVSPFDIYPAPMARNCQDGAFIERMRLSYAELFDMIGVEGYDEDAIRWALATHQGGLLKNWVWTDADRARLENDATFSWFAQDHLIDALQYWGSVNGRDLIHWGVKGDIDAERRYEVDAIVIGSRCIRVAINDDPLGRRPYRGACYEENPDSIWGLNAVPELCEASQQACNAAARAIINNMGIASGPQVWIDIDRLPPGDPVTQLFPWKIWQFNKPDPGQTGSAATPMQFFQPSMVTQELLSVYNTFNQASDDTTGIPRYSYGDEKVGGAGATMGGLSMLMGAAARRIRRAIGSIDYNVMQETVYDVFIYCMLHNDDHQIKGDCIVVPKGSAALLIKEQQQQGRQTAMQVILQNPMLQRLIGVRGVAEMVRDWLKGLHLPDVMPDGPEFDKIVAQIEQSMANPPAPPQMQVAQQNNQTKQAIETQRSQKDVLLKAIEHPAHAAMIQGMLTDQTNAQTQQGPSGGNPPPQQQFGL